MTVATDLPPVWLTPAAGEGLEAALHGVRACVSISAQLDPERAATASDQLSIVFLEEAANETDARRLAAAAQPTKSHEAVGLSGAQVCCVLIASSFVVGVKTFERRGALSRFVQPLSRVLDATIGHAAG